MRPSTSTSARPPPSGSTSPARSRLRAVTLEFASKVRRIPVYPAADGYASEGPVAKLASNESPYGPLPEVVEAATRALTGANRYPDPTNAALRTRLSDRYGVPANRVAIGNGSCDILLAAGGAAPVAAAGDGP